MKLGLVIPTILGEKRVALLPAHICGFENDIVIEYGFGASMGIPDEDYIKAGCEVADKDEIFSTCEAVFSLKPINPIDYPLIKKGQILIGWFNPAGFGAKFFNNQAIPKNLIVVDLESNFPALYYKNQIIKLPWIPRNFIWKNSFNAGYASTMHALLSYGTIVDSNTNVAVLGSGNVSQGAYQLISKLGANARIFYRKTLEEFKENIHEFDIIINGIGIRDKNGHIITLEDQKNLKDGCLVINAAADVCNAIEGMSYTTIDKPIYKYGNAYYYAVENSPSIVYRESSKVLSEAFSKYVFRKELSILYDLIKNQG